MTTEVSFIDIISKFAIIDIALATAFGMSMNSLIKSLNTNILIPLISKYINFPSINFGNILLGGFIESLMEFVILNIVFFTMIYLFINKWMKAIVRNAKEKEQIQIDQKNLLEQLVALEDKKVRLFYPFT